MKILWNSNSFFTKNEGYKTSRDEITSRLLERGFEISFAQKEASEDVKLLLENNINIQYVNKFYVGEANILINNTLPDSYIKSNGYNIGFTYWETNQLPSTWVDEMNQMDEIWTTSVWAREVFINSGVTVPVFDFKLGVDPKLYYPKLREKHNPFTFFSIGSPSTRKNSQMSVDAFLKLFSENDNVRMIYKSIGPPDARCMPNTPHMKSLYGHPKIDVVDIDLSNFGLAKLYDSTDCVLFPTSGEGWGWMPMQGIAKGIPTICTNATACTEYAALSVPLDFDFVPNEIPGIYSNSGTWAKPKFDDLCDKMLYVYNNYEKVAEDTYKNASENFERMTWDYAIDGFQDRLCQISKNIKNQQF